MVAQLKTSMGVQASVTIREPWLTSTRNWASQQQAKTSLPRGNSLPLLTQLPVSLAKVRKLFLSPTLKRNTHKQDQLAALHPRSWLHGQIGLVTFGHAKWTLFIVGYPVHSLATNNLLGWILNNGPIA